MRYQEEMLGRKFNLNPITYMQALLSIEHREDMSSVFCSQVCMPYTPQRTRPDPLTRPDLTWHGPTADMDLS